MNLKKIDKKEVPLVQRFQITDRPIPLLIWTELGSLNFHVIARLFHSFDSYLHLDLIRV